MKTDFTGRIIEYIPGVAQCKEYSLYIGICTRNNTSHVDINPDMTQFIAQRICTTFEEAMMDAVGLCRDIMSWKQHQYDNAEHPDRQVLVLSHGRAVKGA